MAPGAARPAGAPPPPRRRRPRRAARRRAPAPPPRHAAAPHRSVSLTARLGHTLQAVAGARWGLRPLERLSPADEFELGTAINANEAAVAEQSGNPQAQIVAANKRRFQIGMRIAAID